MRSKRDLQKSADGLSRTQIRLRIDRRHPKDGADDDVGVFRRLLQRVTELEAVAVVVHAAEPHRQHGRAVLLPERKKFRHLE